MVVCFSSLCHILAFLRLKGHWGACYCNHWVLLPLSQPWSMLARAGVGCCRCRILHVLSVQRSFVLFEDIFLLGIVSVGLFLIVNLGVTCYSQVITTHSGLVCIPALSVRLGLRVRKIFDGLGRLGSKRLFLHRHPFDLSSHSTLFSKAWSLYFWHQAKPDEWRVWNLLLCQLVPEACGHSRDIVGIITAGAPSAQHLFWVCFSRMWKLKCSVLEAGAEEYVGMEGWGLRGQSTSHCSLPGVMLDCDDSEIGLCKTYLKFHDCSTGR